MVITKPTEWYGYLLAIRETPNWVAKDNWQRSFIVAGESLFCKLEAEKFDADGQLYSGRKIHGRYQFVDAQAVQEAFSNRGWLSIEPPCPWVGHVRGFLNWEWWTPSIDDRSYDAERFIGASKGYIVRLRDDSLWDGIRENEYSLGEAHQKHGFGDGDDLPNLGNHYDSYVWNVISLKLDSIGLKAKRINYGTSHNRIRFDELIPQTAETWQRFEMHKGDTLKIWAFNNDRKSLISLIEEEKA